MPRPKPLDLGHALENRRQTNIKLRKQEANEAATVSGELFGASQSVLDIGAIDQAYLFSKTADLNAPKLDVEEVCPSLFFEMPFIAEEEKSEVDSALFTSFHSWRRSLEEHAERRGLTLSPYEKNLKIWRELYLCLWNCDVLVQVVDARNPEFYVNLDVFRVFLSGQGKRVESKLRAGQSMMNGASKINGDSRMNGDSRINGDSKVNGGSKGLFDWNPAQAVSTASKCFLIFNKADLVPREVLDQWIVHYQKKWTEMMQVELSVNWGSTEDWSKLSIIPYSALEVSGRTSLDENSLSKLDWIEDLAKANKDSEDGLKVGFCGYPNVGKSSVVNSLVSYLSASLDLSCRSKLKRVACSASPGRTRHVQTVVLSSRLSAIEEELNEGEVSDEDAMSGEDDMSDQEDVSDEDSSNEGSSSDYENKSSRSSESSCSDESSGSSRSSGSASCSDSSCSDSWTGDDSDSESDLGSESQDGSISRSGFTLTLMDSPGLVLPSVSRERSAFVIANVLPIDRILSTDLLSGVEYLLRKAEVNGFLDAFLSEIFSKEVMLKCTSTTSVSAIQVLEAVANTKRYFISLKRPDVTKSAKYLLKLVMTGEMTYYERPIEMLGAALDPSHQSRIVSHYDPKESDLTASESILHKQGGSRGFGQNTKLTKRAARFLLKKAMRGAVRVDV